MNKQQIKTRIEKAEAELAAAKEALEALEAFVEFHEDMLKPG